MGVQPHRQDGTNYPRPGAHLSPRGALASTLGVSGSGAGHRAPSHAATRVGARRGTTGVGRVQPPHSSGCDGAQVFRSLQATVAAPQHHMAGTAPPVSLTRAAPPLQATRGRPPRTCATHTHLTTQQTISRTATHNPHTTPAAAPTDELPSRGYRLHAAPPPAPPP